MSVETRKPLYTIFEIVDVELVEGELLWHTERRESGFYDFNEAATRLNYWQALTGHDCFVDKETVSLITLLNESQERITEYVYAA